jgi:hypothetical protein
MDGCVFIRKPRNVKNGHASLMVDFVNLLYRPRSVRFEYRQVMDGRMKRPSVGKQYATRPGTAARPSSRRVQ